MENDVSSGVGLPLLVVDNVMDAEARDLVEGLTNPQIAQRLLIGSATVKSHLEHIFTKTDLHTRAELAGEAVRRRSINDATMAP